MQNLRWYPCRETDDGEWVVYDPRVAPFGRQIVQGDVPQEGDFFVNDNGEIIRLNKRDNNFQFTSELLEEGRFFRPQKEVSGGTHE